MAKGRRGGRRAPNQRGPQTPRPTRVSRRGGGAKGPAVDELPTAAPGAANTPDGGASVLGAGSVNVTAGAGRSRGSIRRRNRGGPRSESERERSSGGLRTRAVTYDFRYIGSDLRWIFATTVASVGAVLAIWVVIRL